MLIGFILIVPMVFFALIMMSPRQDIHKRGFIPCTEQLVENFTACNGKTLCMCGTVLQNTHCDFKVIFQGFGNWMDGQQPTPWANYIFEPVLLEEEEMTEDLQEFYDNNPDLDQQMQELKKLNKELENGKI